MELIEIFFDTNYIRRKKIDDFSKFYFGTPLEDFIDFLGTNDVVDCYKINISEITIMELKKQINDEYEEELIKLNKSYNKFKSVVNIKYDEDEKIEYNDMLEKMIKEYLEFRNINVVKIKNIELQNLLMRAIDKKKPFVGEKGISDKGFKDAVLWESIIEYAKISSNKEFILFTKNTHDFPKELEEEFEKRTNKKIKIIYEISMVQKEILLQQSQDVNDILTANWIKENMEYFIEEFNDYLKDGTNIKNDQIEKITKVEDLVNKGNNFYSFMVYINENDVEYQWYVEVEYINNEIYINEIMPCV